MTDVHDFDDLVASIPLFLERLWRDASGARPDLDALVAAQGWGGPVRFRGPYGTIELETGGAADEEREERRLRTAITRRVGKPAGGDRHWDVGAFDVRLGLRRGGVRLDLTAKRSLAAIRRAAKDWLDGRDGEEWLLAHRFIDADAEPGERGFWPKPADLAGNPFAKRREDGRVRAQLYLDASARPPGVKAGDDEGFALTLEYLAETLGEQEDPSPLRPNVWRRGRRTLRIKHMRSRSRSVEFDEDAD